MVMFNKLPYSIILQGKKYRINADFRNMIFFEKEILNKSIDKDKRLEKEMKYFYPYFFNNYEELLRTPKLYKEACEKLIWFYKCGREDYHKIKGNNNTNISNTQIYSYKFDDEYIYGAFYEQYGIDLSYEKVHWWKFKALLKSLKSDTEFVKIKGYRAYNGKDKNMLELKEYWQLPQLVEEQERLNRIFEELK